MTIEISAIFTRGVFGSRPAPGNAGAHYWATDTGLMYRDNGVSWDTETPLGFPSTFTLSGIISPTQLAANTDDWAPTGLSTASIIRASTDASRNLTGLTGGSAGRVILLCNVGAQNLVLKHDVTSTNANRFYCSGSADATISANGSKLLCYDGTSSRWRVF